MIEVWWWIGRRLRGPGSSSSSAPSRRWSAPNHRGSTVSRHRPASGLNAATVLSPDDAVGQDLLGCANHNCIGPRIVVAHPVDFKAIETLCSGREIITSTCGGNVCYISTAFFIQLVAMFCYGCSLKVAGACTCLLGH